MAEWPERLLLATGNAEKVAELAPLLARLGVEAVVAPLPSPPEDGETYEQNAVIKARAAAAATGLPALGDDAGLEVDTLHGRPGLDTRPWADALGGWPAARDALRAQVGSGARFRSGLALAWPDGPVFTALGTTEGEIVPASVPGVGLEPCFRAAGTDAPLPSLRGPARDEVHYRVRALAALCGRLAHDRLIHAVGELVVRAPAPGDLGWVVARSAGWPGGEARAARVVADLLGGGRGAASVALVDGRRAGFAIARPTDAGAELSVLVEPWARRRGLGRRLVDACSAAVPGPLVADAPHDAAWAALGFAPGPDGRAHRP